MTNNDKTPCGYEAAKLAQASALIEAAEKLLFDASVCIRALAVPMEYQADTLENALVRSIRPVRHSVDQRMLQKIEG